jgi:SagB-type dehydrogenase family enzyme
VLNVDEQEFTKVVHYKTYPRFERFKVEGDVSPRTTLEELLINRRTRRESSDQKLDIEKICRILNFSAGRTEGDFRAYPSAGARYPIEIYLIVINVDSMEPGIYHYSPSDNAIEFLWLKDYSEEIAATLGADMNDFLNEARVILIMTSIDGRTTVKYGNEGLDFPLIESGYIGANVTLLCEEQGLHSVVIGTQWWKGEIAEIIDIDISREEVVSAIAIL